MFFLLPQVCHCHYFSFHTTITLKKLQYVSSAIMEYHNLLKRTVPVPSLFFTDFAWQKPVKIRGATANLSQARPAQYSTPNLYDRLILIRAYWNPKSRQGPGLGGLVSHGAPENTTWTVNTFVYISHWISLNFTECYHSFLSNKRCKTPFKVLRIYKTCMNYCEEISSNLSKKV